MGTLVNGQASTISKNKNCLKFFICYGMKIASVKIIKLSNSIHEAEAPLV